MTRHRDPFAKRALRFAFRQALGAQVIATSRARRGPARVWYAGARAGDVGGTLVKLQRLTARFPEHRARYNVAYLLSNASYLSAAALERLRRRGIATVLNQDGVFYPAWYGGDWRAMNARMSLAYHRADHVFWQSEFCRVAADLFLGPRAGPGAILHNAVDTRHFAPPTRRAARDRVTFLMTGKFDRERAYRLHLAVAALRLARAQGLAARLIVAGAVDSALRAAIDAPSDGVAWRGRYAQAEAPAIYAEGDVYLSLAHNDPCPNAVIEALSCGLPVLHAASGGVPELVGEEAGLGLPVALDWERVQLPSPEAVARAMIDIAARRGAMAEAARRRAVARFDIQHWLDRHEAVFGALLAARA